MKSEKTLPKNIDEYISGFPQEIRLLLEEIRLAIRNAAPEATEAMSYQMPTFRLKGNLIHFAAFKNHIGLYPAPTGIEAFRKELSVYKGGKGSVQFPITDPLPLDLITRIVRFRVEENRKKGEQKVTK